MKPDVEIHRRFLFAMAYRMLGSAADAEDVVQDAYIRYLAVPEAEVESPKALLGTIVTRLCLNLLGSARRRRETYVGSWLPEPIWSEADALDASSPLARWQSVSVAFLVVLEQLSPLERAVFVLHELFDYDHVEIARVVERTPAACRKLGSRAREHLERQRPRFPPTPEAHRELVARFARSVGSGDLRGLVDLLAEDVVLDADSGGRFSGAVLAPLRGREAVAGFVASTPRLPAGPFDAAIGDVNGEPALVLRGRTDAAIRVVITLEIEGGVVRAIRAMANPDKLRWLNASRDR
ncbi:RNA polymerase sigma factor SigJ [Sorangium sp. So ce1099]|uniref:RNA polymerase sigma factor SigJ n=1 Tax=Sorangium sp. So ce1099 TaxID=3133331 RepID=UPI003F60BAAA